MNGSYIENMDGLYCLFAIEGSLQEVVHQIIIHILMVRAGNERDALWSDYTGHHGYGDWLYSIVVE